MLKQQNPKHNYTIHPSIYPAYPTQGYKVTETHPRGLCAQGSRHPRQLSHHRAQLHTHSFNSGQFTDANLLTVHFLDWGGNRVFIINLQSARRMCKLHIHTHTGRKKETKPKTCKFKTNMLTIKRPCPIRSQIISIPFSIIMQSTNQPNPPKNGGHIFH